MGSDYLDTIELVLSVLFCIHMFTDFVFMKRSETSLLGGMVI